MQGKVPCDGCFFALTEKCDFTPARKLHSGLDFLSPSFLPVAATQIFSREKHCDGIRPNRMAERERTELYLILAYVAGARPLFAISEAVKL